MHKRHTRKDLEELAEFIRKESGPVCDSDFKCAEWEKYVEADCVSRHEPSNNEWKYCPWCGREITK